MSRKMLLLDACEARCPAIDRLPPIKPDVQAQLASLRNERRFISFHLSMCRRSGGWQTTTALGQLYLDGRISQIGYEVNRRRTVNNICVVKKSLVTCSGIIFSDVAEKD